MVEELGVLPGLRFGRREWGDQGGAFEQAAKVFFARVQMLALGELEIRGGFVAYFEPLELYDPNEFLTAAPDLALLQFHGVGTHLS
jgi:hypothetical protein